MRSTTSGGEAAIDDEGLYELLIDLPRPLEITFSRSSKVARGARTKLETGVGSSSSDNIVTTTGSKSNITANSASGGGGGGGSSNCQNNADIRSDQSNANGKEMTDNDNKEEWKLTSSSNVTEAVTSNENAEERYRNAVGAETRHGDEVSRARQEEGSPLEEAQSLLRAAKDTFLQDHRPAQPHPKSSTLPTVGGSGVNESSDHMIVHPRFGEKNPSLQPTSTTPPSPKRQSPTQQPIRQSKKALQSTQKENLEENMSATMEIAGDPTDSDTRAL